MCFWSDYSAALGYLSNSVIYLFFWAWDVCLHTISAVSTRSHGEAKPHPLYLPGDGRNTTASMHAVLLTFGHLFCSCLFLCPGLSFPSTLLLKILSVVVITLSTLKLFCQWNLAWAFLNRFYHLKWPHFYDQKNSHELNYDVTFFQEKLSTSNRLYKNDDMFKTVSRWFIFTPSWNAVENNSAIIYLHEV